MAVLLRSGELDESGKLCSGPEYRIGDTDVVLTQKDIREMQLAKGAISAGIDLLAERLGIQLTDIRRVCIAGAFGNYMSPDSACAIGLLPPELRQRIVPVGNAAGEGAKLAVLRPDQFELSKRLSREVNFLELANDPDFQDIFVDELPFDSEEE